MSLKPEATSTPNQVPYVRGRDPIGKRHRDSTQSPIISAEGKHHYKTRSSSRSYENSPRKKSVVLDQDHSTSNEDYSDSDLNSSPKAIKNRNSNRNSGSQQNCLEQIYNNSKPEYTNNRKSDSPENFLNWIVVLVLCLLSASLFFIWGSFSNSVADHNVEVQDMCNLSQKLLKDEKDDEFCIKIKLNLLDITDFDRTKTIVFLYENQASERMEKILQEVSKFAVCHLSQCFNKPVIIEGQFLSQPKYANDYGKFFTDYSDLLENNKVLILKNLEKLAPTSAQVLHAICDEYTPVVKRALILLTMKVNKLPDGAETSFLRSSLSKLWSTLGRGDKFDPLFNRISETILPVHIQ